MGHCLGNPTNRSDIPSPERSLSPAACSIIRILMHSALLWATCNIESTMEHLLSLIKPAVPSNVLPEFFLGHLQRDLKLLSLSLGKNMEDAAVLVHLIIRRISLSPPPKGLCDLEIISMYKYCVCKRFYIKD